LPQETILKRAADLAEVLYSMPRSHGPQLGLPPPPTSTRSPASGLMSGAGVNGSSLSGGPVSGPGVVGPVPPSGGPGSVGGGGAFNSYAGPLTAVAAAAAVQVDSVGTNGGGGPWDDAWSHRYPAFTF
jgi:hypothetical protein